MVRRCPRERRESRIGASLLGAIHEPPLSTLALGLAGPAGARDFVETGTFLGDALGWAARHFERVWTVEINADYQAHARRRHTGCSNIRYFLGDSASALGQICRQLHGPAVFWLDAHAGAGFFAQEDRCPLLAELQIVAESPHQHLIFVDDARAFVAPPPPPFDYRKWPALEEIFRIFAGRRDYRAVLMADALIVVPGRLRDLLANWCIAVRPNI